MAKTDKTNRSYAAYIVLGAFLISAFFIYRMFTAETNNGLVNMVLKKGDKVYVYSHMGTFLVDSDIKEGKSPNATAFLHMYEEDDKLYMAPNNLKNIVDLLCGNYQIHDYAEESSDGYVTSANSTCFESTYTNQNTRNIGEQVSINTVKLFDGNTGNTLNIKSETNKKTYKSKALENCYEKSFVVRTNIHPGEFALSSKDFIMVDLQDVVDFYGSQATLTLNKEEQLLYIDYNR